ELAAFHGVWKRRSVFGRTRAKGWCAVCCAEANLAWRGYRLRVFSTRRAASIDHNDLEELARPALASARPCDAVPQRAALSCDAATHPRRSPEDRERDARPLDGRDHARGLLARHSGHAP